MKLIDAGPLDRNLTESRTEFVLEHSEEKIPRDGERDGTGGKRKILCEKHKGTLFSNE